MSRALQRNRQAAKQTRRADLTDRAERRERIARRKGKGAKRPSWFQGKRPILRFVLLFGVCMGVFYAVSATVLYTTDVLMPYLELNAEVSGAILRLLGEDAHVHGQNVSSRRASISIKRGCDAIHPAALFLAAMLAFPAPLRKKLIGAVVGVAVLLTINLVRILSLFYVRIHFRSAFEIMHVEVWQPLFIFLTLLTWIIWAIWATRMPKGRSDDPV